MVADTSTIRGRRNYPVTMNRIRAAGHEVLKSPIGSHRFLLEEGERRTEKLRDKFRNFFDIDDAQISFCLLQSTMGACQMNYLLRTVPSTAMK